MRGGGGGEKKSEHFLMTDLAEDTSRILAYGQIITWEGVVFYWCKTPRSFQGHIKLFQGQTCKLY